MNATDWPHVQGPNEIRKIVLYVRRNARGDWHYEAMREPGAHRIAEGNADTGEEAMMLAARAAAGWAEQARDIAHTYPRCAACGLTEGVTAGMHDCPRCGEDAVVIHERMHREYDTARLADEGKVRGS